MIVEVSIVSFVILAVGGFWIHRKYPKPVPPIPVEFDVQKHIKEFNQFKEEFKAFKVDYTGDMLFGKGPNG